MDKPLSIKEVAKLFNVHPETVRRWARTKKLKAEKIGKLWYFSKESINI